MVTPRLGPSPRLRRSLRLALPIMITAPGLGTPQARAAAQEPVDDRRATVAVLDFKVTALKNAADWAPLGKGIPQILMTELGANTDLRIVERERLQAILEELKLPTTAMVDPATAARVGKLAGARYVLHGGAFIDPNNKLRLDAHGIKVETGVREYSETLSGKADDVLELIARLGRAISTSFDPTPFDAPTERRSGSSGRPTKEGLRLAMLLGNAVERQDRHDVDGAKTLVRQALALAPENPSAKAMLAALERAK